MGFAPQILVRPQQLWIDAQVEFGRTYVNGEPKVACHVSLSNLPRYSLPGLVQRGRVREAILDLPLVYGSVDVVPDQALWAAVVCLGILASIYRYEDRNDGHEGIVRGAKPSAFLNVTGDAVDEEPETTGIPRCVVIPMRQICTRLGRPLPYLSQSDVSIYNYKVSISCLSWSFQSADCPLQIRDATSHWPYLERIDNMVCVR